MESYAMDPNLHYMPGDVNLVEQIVYELKTKGIFDQFRKECISDVDTKPAYQNLRQRVEGSVSSFLSRQRWKPDMNKNQLREKLRKHIQDANYLDQGVERIVDQVVNPKVATVFIPKVEDLVCSFLGIARPKKEEKPETTTESEINNHSSADLEVVSPGSVKSLSDNKENENKMDIDLEIKNGDVDSIIEVSDSQDSLVIKAKEIEDIPLPRSRESSKSTDNLSMDIPLPTDRDPQTIPLPKDETTTNNVTNDDDSSSDSVILRNMSPLTPVRSYNNENSYDAQQAFESNNSDKESTKETSFNFAKDQSKFKFDIDQPDIIEEDSKIDDNSSESRSIEIQTNLSYQFNQHIQLEVNYEESSGSNNLKIDYQSDHNNDTNIDIDDRNSKQSLTSDIPLPQGEPKNGRFENKHRSSVDSKRHSHSTKHKDERSRSKHHSSSRDSERKHYKDSEKKIEKKSGSDKHESSKLDHKKSSKDKSQDESDKRRDSSKDKSKSSSSHKDSKSSSSKHHSSSSHKHSSSHRRSDEKKSSSSDKRSESKDSKHHRSSSKSSSRDQSRHSSSHRSEAKSSKSSSHKSKPDSDKKKDKKDTDDHYSSSGRNQRSRRSTDRDSNDGNSTSSKNSQVLNKSCSESKEKKSTSKSETQSSNTESSAQSDNAETITINENAKEEIDLQMEKMEEELKAMMEPQQLEDLSETNIQEDIMEQANSVYESRKLMKLRKYLENEEVRRQQAATMLIEIQGSVCSSTNKVYPDISGPEFELVCMPKIIEEIIHKPNNCESDIYEESISKIDHQENENFLGFTEEDQLNALTASECYSDFFEKFKTRYNSQPKIKLINCDINIVKLLQSLTDYDIFNYPKNGHPGKIERVKKIVPIDREIRLPYKSPEYSFMSPSKSDCSMESDYNIKLNDMVSKTSRQQIMEIILGGEMTDCSTNLPMLDYCDISNIEVPESSTLKRRRSSDIEANILIPCKERKTSLSDQITSTTEDDTVTHVASKYFGKARRIGLPKISTKLKKSPKSPVSDQSVENYEQNIQGSSIDITPPKVKNRKPKAEIQRYNTSDLYKPKLHFLSRRHNVSS